MSDLIDRQRLKDDIAVLFERNEKLIDEWLANCVDDVIDEQPSADVPDRKVGEWIPVTTRPMDEEERKYYQEIFAWELADEEAVTFTSRMPEDGQEVWVCSKCGNVWIDTCVIDEGIGLEGNGDWLDIVAWMPFTKPTPWKGEDDE